MSKEPHSALPHPVLANVERALWWLTASVWAFPVALYSYAATAAAVVSHWPSYGHPDPKQLELPTFHALVAVSFNISTVAIVLWLVAAPITYRALGSRTVSRYLPFFILGALAGVSCFYPDPAGIGEWYAD